MFNMLNTLGQFRGPLHENLDSSDTILAQISALTNMVKNMQKHPNIQEVKAMDSFCEICGNKHDSSEYGQNPKSSCFVGNYNRNMMVYLGNSSLLSAEMKTSSSSEGMPRQPANAKIQARYTRTVAKIRWEEQGFFFDESLDNYGLEPTIHRRLHELGWFRFARRVAAHSAIINEILGLPNTDPNIYALLRGLKVDDYETIKDFLCEQGREWNTMGKNPHSVSRLSLQPEAKLWNTFVKRNLIPTFHNQTVDRTQLVSINFIMTGYRFNVGELIAQELAAACRNDKGILAFSCIISVLYRRAAIPTSPGDKYKT
ncbi:hypothetical protein GQ457_05G023390 [Hibiscus cannabinus]